ncbi:hypothetical protein JHK86_009630 [Glycine max]|nr:hypothetical protein JHK86_009630 [Glycine max]
MESRHGYLEAGNAWYQLHLVKAEKARAYIPEEFKLVEAFGEGASKRQSLDLEAISTLVTDVDMEKETKPSFYLKHILPIILKNQVIHFVGFGNRLAFDPIAFELQNTSSLCFVGPLDPYLVGPFAKSMKGVCSRLVALTNLYPKLVSKENLLSSAELQSFANYSSQLAALDFIGCTASDAFAMTDSRS